MTATAAAKTITCPNCGGAIAIKAAGYTVTLVCQYCSSVLDVANPDVKVVTAYNEAAAELYIPLGTRGQINGAEWEVIGYLQRSENDEGEAVGWNEYLLFNPYAGYRWLIDSEGEWSIGTMLTKPPTGHDSSGTIYNGVHFSKPYAPATATTDYVLGEFYWRVKAGDTVLATQFESGACKLSLEQNESETNWTLVEPMPSEAMATFGIAGVADDSAPFGSVVPPGYLGLMWKMAGVAALALLIATFLFGTIGPNVTQSFALTLEKPAQTFTIGSITVNRAFQAVSINASAAGINNKWVELDYSLVNRATQQGIDANGVIEYYSGTDSDGAWSEGSSSTKTMFASVPRGTYDLVVDAEAHNWNGRSVSDEVIQVNVSAAAGGVFGSNLLLLFLLLLAPPVWGLYNLIKDSRTSSSDDDYDDYDDD